MKKLFTILCLTAYVFSFSQNKNQDVESSITSIQAGILGFWVNHESKIYKHTVLRGEIGMGMGYSKHKGNKSTWVLSPNLRLEPKYYYNIERRLNKGKNIANNSANFFSLPITYTPDWFVISNKENSNVVPSISIVPSYGLKRNINTHLNYEFAFGLGYHYRFLKQIGYEKNESAIIPNLTLRLGYTF